MQKWIRMTLMSMTATLTTIIIISLWTSCGCNTCFIPKPSQSKSCIPTPIEQLLQIDTKPTKIQQADFCTTDFPGVNFDSGEKSLGNLDRRLLFEHFLLLEIMSYCTDYGNVIDLSPWDTNGQGCFWLGIWCQAPDSTMKYCTYYRNLGTMNESNPYNCSKKKMCWDLKWSSHLGLASARRLRCNYPEKELRLEITMSISSYFVKLSGYKVIYNLPGNSMHNSIVF